MTQTLERPADRRWNGDSSFQCSIMLIDDNEALLEVLRDALSSQGVRVSTFTNATDALAAMGTSAPDCIICDIMMPGMDGYEFHARVRSSLEWSNIPFIFLTALAEPNDVRQAKAQGCDDYLTKPFDPADLVAVVKGKLSRARERESLVESRLDRYRRRIVHTLSHEFRTPLVAINTGTEILLEQYDALDTVRVGHLLASIKRGGQRLQRLVDDFMLLQQIDSGVAQSAFGRLHALHALDEIAETAVRLHDEALDGGAANVELFLGAQSEKSYVDVYDVQVIDVVRRLLSNAYKFGGPKNVIQVSTVCGEERAADGKVSKYHAIVVRDFGPGMTENAVQQVCRRFTQIDRERFEQQGCGLGLSIAAYFTELNGGCLSFHRPSDGGLQVEVRFPVPAV